MRTHLCSNATVLRFERLLLLLADSAGRGIMRWELPRPYAATPLSMLVGSQMFSQLLADDISLHSSIADALRSSGETHEQHIEQLFREHNDSLLRFLRARLRSREEASEVAQEAYVQLLRLDNPEVVHFLQGYLFRTAANLAKNRLKQRMQRQRDDELVFFETEDARSPERVCEGDRSVALVNQALGEMPAKCREAFRLVRLEGLSSDEAAQRLSLHARQVRRYVARALAHCLAAVETEGVGGEESHEARVPDRSASHRRVPTTPARGGPPLVHGAPRC